MLSRLILAASLAATLLLSGCATPTQMPFAKDTDTVSNKPIFLMTATTRNAFKTGYQPKLVVVNVEKATVKDSNDRINFTLDDKAKKETDSPIEGNNYLLRMALEPGEYVIQGLTSINQSLFIIG